VIARLLALTLLLMAGGVLALLVRRPGRSRAVTGSARLTPADLGAPLGTSATYVQFSTSACTPCRTVRRALGELAATRPDIVHVELDAEQHLDLVRRHRVLTTPTVLLLDAQGLVRRRLTGATDRATLVRALTGVTSPAAADSPESSTSADSEGARA
jgi:thiol-disulfide isomerase/thioredoxin